MTIDDVRPLLEKWVGFVPDGMVEEVWEAIKEGQKGERKAKADAGKVRAALKNLSGGASQYLAAMDAVMCGPSTPERGRKIAALSNALDMANDRVRYHSLGVDFKKDKKPEPSPEILAILAVLLPDIETQEN